MFEELHQLLASSDAEIAGCRYNVLHDDENDKKQERDSSLPEYETITTSEATRRVLMKCGVSDAIWDKLYAKRLFENIKMIEGMVYEDQEVLLRLFAATDHIIMTNHRLYNYYRRHSNDSITQSTISPTRHDLLKARSYMHETVARHFPEIEQIARNRYFEAALSFLYASKELGDEKLRKDLKSEINDFASKNGGLRQRTDITACLCAMKCNIRLFDSLFKIREWLKK